ncbi:MAG: hypothetical protein QM704_17535 [Anaeromyxobacteraceae bacterium]
MPRPVSEISMQTRPARLVRVAARILVLPGGALRDCLRRVHEELQHDLREPPLDRTHRGDLLERAHEPGPRADAPRRDREGGLDHPAHVDLGELGPVAAGERLQVAHDRAHSLRGLPRLAERRRDLVAARQPRERRLELLGGEAQVREEARERVVELVGEAAGERADRGEPLVQREAGLHEAGLRDVAEHHEVAARQDPRDRAPLQGQGGPVGEAERELALRAPALAEVLPVGPELRLERAPRGSGAPAASEAEEPPGRGVRRHPLPGVVERHEPILGVLEHGPRLALALGEGPLRRVPADRRRDGVRERVEEVEVVAGGHAVAVEVRTQHAPDAGAPRDDGRGPPAARSGQGGARARAHEGAAQAPGRLAPLERPARAGREEVHVAAQHARGAAHGLGQEGVQVGLGERERPERGEGLVLLGALGELALTGHGRTTPGRERIVGRVRGRDHRPE